MARVIPRSSIIYRIQYGACLYEFVECSGKEDLFRYIASQKDRVPTGVNEMCFNGATPRIAFKTDPQYKRILRELDRPRIVEVKEDLFKNKNGYHYYLTPINKSDKELLGDYSVHTQRLSRAKNSGKVWMAEMSDKFNIKIIMRKDTE